MNDEILVAKQIDFDGLLAPSRDILPDSRTRIATHVTRSPRGNLGILYCYNCGAEAGLVPVDENTQFAFALCPKCAEDWGPEAHRYTEPHVEFWKRVIAAQLEMYRRILGHDELVRIASDEQSPFAKLIRTGE